MRATTSWSTVGICDPAHISHSSGASRTTASSGSNLVAVAEVGAAAALAVKAWADSGAACPTR